MSDGLVLEVSFSLSLQAGKCLGSGEYEESAEGSSNPGETCLRIGRIMLSKCKGNVGYLGDRWGQLLSVGPPCYSRRHVDKTESLKEDPLRKFKL
jgi:hypothetical protein